MDIWVLVAVACYFLVGYLLTDLLISWMDEAEQKQDHLWVTRVVGTMIWPYVIISAFLFAPKDPNRR